MTLRLKQYAQFRGRSGRKEYWLFLFRLLLFYSALVFGAVGLRSHAALRPLFSALHCTYVLAVSMPLTAYTVRRLHDAGVSGWCALIIVIPIVGVAVLLKLLGERGDPGELAARI